MSPFLVLICHRVPGASHNADTNTELWVGNEPPVLEYGASVHVIPWEDVETLRVQDGTVILFFQGGRHVFHFCIHREDTRTKDSEATAVHIGKVFKQILDLWALHKSGKEIQTIPEKGSVIGEPA